MKEEFKFKYVVCGKVTAYNKDHAEDRVKKRLGDVIDNCYGGVNVSGVLFQLEDNLTVSSIESWGVKNIAEDLFEDKFSEAYKNIFGDLMDLIEKPKFFDRKNYFEVRKDLVENLKSRERRFLKKAKEEYKVEVTQILCDAWVKRIGTMNCEGGEEIDIRELKLKALAEKGDEEEFDCGDVVVSIRRKGCWE